MKPKHPRNHTRTARAKSRRLIPFTYTISLIVAASQGFAEPVDNSQPKTSEPSQHSSKPDINEASRDFRSRLEDRGFSPYAVFTTEFLSNVDGGIQHGTTTPGLLDFGVEVDLEKYLGWKGGGVTITAFAGYGEDGSAENIGDFNVASNLFTETDFNIFNLFLSQTLGDGTFYIKAGQIAADDDFMSSEIAGLFLNSAFGPLPTESGNTGAPIFPLAAPGAYTQIKASEALSLHVGIFAGDAGPVESGNHGFDWRTGGAAGWVSFLEAQFHHDNGAIKIGGYHHSGEFTNFQATATEDGLSSIYAIIDQRFFEAKDRAPGLSGFLRGAFVAQDQRATVSHYLDGGLVLDHLFCKGDALGFALSYTVFSDDYLAATPGVTANETILEITYQVPLSQNWLIQPDLQWILNSHTAKNDALIVGLRTEISF